MLRIDPAQRTRLVEIIDNLQKRQNEARDKGWLGEVQGLQVSLDAATNKLSSLDRRQRTNLGMPTIMHTE
jgi:hypothetical protein